MRLFCSSLAAAALFVSAPAFANDPAVAAAPTPAKAKKDKMVCKNQQFVGSRIRQSICKRQSEWDAARQNARDAMDDRSRGDPSPTKGAAGG